MCCDLIRGLVEVISRDEWGYNIVQGIAGLWIDRGDLVIGTEQDQIKSPGRAGRKVNPASGQAAAGHLYNGALGARPGVDGMLRGYMCDIIHGGGSLGYAKGRNCCKTILTVPAAACSKISCTSFHSVGSK